MIVIQSWLLTLMAALRSFSSACKSLVENHHSNAAPWGRFHSGKPSSDLFKSNTAITGRVIRAEDDSLLVRYEPQSDKLSRPHVDHESIQWDLAADAQ